MKKAVSIIIPVYNAEKEISRCLESVLAQTFTDFEVILLNDGSKDNSLHIIKKYEEEYDNIIVIDKANEGVAITRNKGITIANGEFLMFIDNDDFIDKDYVERFYQTISQSEFDIVIGGYRRVNNENKVIFQEKLIDSEWTKYIFLAPWAKIYRKSFIVENGISFLDFPIGEDLYFSFSIYSRTSKISILNYVGYNWFYNNDSISNTTQRGLDPSIDITVLLDEILKLYNHNRHHYIRYFFKRYYIWYLLFSGRYATKKEFMREYKRVRKWITDNNLDDVNVFSLKYSADRFHIRVYICIFSMLEKLHLIPLFANFYCLKK